jgi:photosystem II stability/assembly factor-like uncharacterized protein
VDNNDNLVVPFAGFMPALFCLHANSSSLFCGTSDGVFQTSSSGGSWTRMYQGMMDESFRYPAIYAMTENSTHIFAGASYFNGMYVSTDGGGTWTIKNSGLPENLDIFCMIVVESEVFAGTDKGIYKTSNNGGSWISVSSGLPVGYNIFSLAVAGSKIFAATNGAGVFVSDNSGESWTEKNNGLSCLMLSSMVASNKSLFAGHDYGVSVSSDNGANWFDIIEGLPQNTFVLSLGANTTELYAAVGGGDVWRMDLSEVNVKKNREKAAVISSLRTYNSSNEIHVAFSLEQPQNITFRIYNVSGAEVAFPVNDHFIAGAHNISLKGPNIAPGSYILHMHTLTGIQTKNIILLK